MTANLPNTLSIRVDFISDVVLLVPISPLISRSFRLFPGLFETLSSASITICMTVTYTFHNFLSFLNYYSSETLASFQRFKCNATYIFLTALFWGRGEQRLVSSYYSLKCFSFFFQDSCGLYFYCPALGSPWSRLLTESFTT